MMTMEIKLSKQLGGGNVFQKCFFWESMLCLPAAAWFWFTWVW
jgi:hypothetical protein